MLKRYIKSSVAISTLFISHQVFALPCSYSGDTTITADCEGGTISDSDSTITINAGVTIDLTAFRDLTVNDGIDIAAFINNGTISGGTSSQNFRAYRSNDIGSFTNNGTVTLNGTQSFYIYNNNSDPGNHGTFTNTGTWSSNGSQSFYAAQATSWTSFTNSGSFIANGEQSFYITGSGGSIGTLSNSGTFTTNGDSSFYLGTGYTISSFDNSGTWALGASGAALYGTITTLTNTGTISGTLKNSLGTITTFNNDQGSIGSPVAFDSRLPSNYNIIINSTSDYGKVVFANAIGTTNFGVYSTSAIDTSATYSSVIDGLTSAELNNTTTGTVTLSGTLYRWTLSDADRDLVWDLNFSYPPPQLSILKLPFKPLKVSYKGT